MKNLMDINGYKAVISYDPEIELFRGEFIDLNGGADFYADSLENLKKEGEQSLQLFLKLCEEKGISPTKKFSGKFNLRIDPKLHQAITAAAKSQGLSLNQWIENTLKQHCEPA